MDCCEEDLCNKRIFVDKNKRSTFENGDSQNMEFVKKANGWMLMTIVLLGTLFGS